MVGFTNIMTTVVSFVSLIPITLAAVPRIYGTDAFGPDLQLAHLYTVRIKPGPPIEVGAGPRGNRVVYPNRGGEFEGPLIKGKVLPIGGDVSIHSLDFFSCAYFSLLRPVSSRQRQHRTD